MKKYDIALFDLDGTLSESGEGILDCVKIVFAEMQRPLPDEKTLASFIGPPLTDSLKRCGFSEKDAEKGLQIYKKNFVEKGIYKNKVYEGMYETLQALKENGVLLGVATTKYQNFAGTQRKWCTAWSGNDKISALCRQNYQNAEIG